MALNFNQLHTSLSLALQVAQSKFKSKLFVWFFLSDGRGKKDTGNTTVQWINKPSFKVSVNSETTFVLSSTTTLNNTMTGWLTGFFVRIGSLSCDV